MPTFVKVILGIIVAVVALAFSAFMAAALLPQPADPPVDMNNHGAGASSVEPSYSGLQREFPATNEPDSNPTTAEKVALGHQLFFDPILSENNDASCATCHHPDLGFSDGQAVAVGPGGTELTRNTPTLWNVAYAEHMFWDGRLDSLESQSEFPLTHPDEMGVTDTDAMLEEIMAIPAYVDLFDEAFGGGDSAVTLENVQNALAAFQRSIISDDSPFDRYAAGDFDALTPAQRRGLALFRSGATRCFECHTAPTFATDTFRVIGVPSDDPGRAAIADDGSEGAFKVPTLRNIALSAPYMHNGSMATLEEVVDFYAEGGGLAHGRDDVDVFVNGFELTDQERADLVAFMYALTDESQIPDIPQTVPSGLPVVEPRRNPERAVAEEMNVGTSGSTVADRAPMTITVMDNEPIQNAVDRARPGDIIEIPYGLYNERVVIDASDITLTGVPNEDGEYPILDGEGLLPEGVIASGNNFEVANLYVRNYTDNGILVEGVTGVHFHDLKVEDTGTYGVYPVQSTDVLVERVEVSGVDDAGIYAGQSENVIVRDVVAYGNVLGIELENTVNGEVYDNHVYDNTLGILIVVLPQLTAKASSNTIIHDNLIEDNNLANFADEGFARFAPVGTGVLLLGADNVEVTNNVIKDNQTVGVAIYSLTRSGVFDINELDVGPLPENVYVYDNEYSNNGYDPADMVAELGVPGADILWDGSGNNIRFNEPDATSFPPVLPSATWPSRLQKGYSNILNYLIENML